MQHTGGMMRLLLAHQGGWDELAYFAIPAVVAILAVRWAEKRAKRRHVEAQAAQQAGDAAPPTIDD